VDSLSQNEMSLGPKKDSAGEKELKSAPPAQRVGGERRFEKNYCVKGSFKSVGKTSNAKLRGVGSLRDTVKKPKKDSKSWGGSENAKQDVPPEESRLAGSCFDDFQARNLSPRG